MGGGGNVENRKVVAGGLEDIHHRRAQHAAVNRDSFAGFEPYLDAEFFAGLAHESDQSLAIVEWLGDPVAAAHVEVGELRRAQQVAEFFIDGKQRFFEVVRILLAERVKMQA